MRTFRVYQQITGGIPRIHSSGYTERQEADEVARKLNAENSGDGYTAFVTADYQPSDQEESWWPAEGEQGSGGGPTP